MADESALERAAREHFQFLWRCLRRLGVQPDHAVDDAAQRVFEIAAKKRDQIAPGNERAYLFKTALLVAAEERRRSRRAAREALDETALLNAKAPELPPDEALDAQRWRTRLDLVLEALGAELRTVFVLYEFERLSGPEIAELLDLPLGTVASRLRRARNEFRAATQRLRAQLRTQGELP
ncbi:MAG TPA: sigma-70 family RNA polymerase sigma factor [Polyangiales bacterium]|nr:sigma-70 family RNA polymerase sigma factor [Polyangiales bacterium]